MQPGIYRVPSHQGGGHRYTVAIGYDGEASCTCRGYEIRGTCSHPQDIGKDNTMTTETSVALVPIRVEPPKSILPTKAELNIIGTIARTAVLARGHAVPASIDSAAKAAAVMLAGHELGVKPMTALRHIFVINGRTEPDAQIMAGIVQAHESDAAFDIVELTAEKCTMRLSRPSKGPKAVWEYTYELEDARKAGLVQANNPWGKFPKDMMRWAATKRLCRAFAPDLINSVGTVEVSAINDLLAASEDDTEETMDIKAIPQGALYNDGDEDAGPAEQLVPITDAQRQSLQRLLNKLNQQDDAKKRPAYKYLAEKFPRVFPPWGAPGSIVLANLSTLEASAVHDYIQEALQHGATQQVGVPATDTSADATAAPRPAASPPEPCEHEASFDDAKAILTCSKCGIALEGPPAEMAQASLIS